MNRQLFENCHNFDFTNYSILATKLPQKNEKLSE
nr:MAG TPA: hypothetical protein [Caudoviricetes sp.]